MSDYARANTGGATHFGDKDALSTGTAAKVIVGSEHDTEFNAILTAVNSKYDSGDLSSQAEAEAGTNNATVMTPLRTEQWSAVWAAENGGMVGDIQALADPGADTLLGWDDSASAAIGFTAGTGIAFSGTTITTDDSAIVISNLSGYAANDNINHALVSVIAGTGLTGGGTIDGNLTLDVIGGDGITANANDIAITDVVAGTAQPVVITSGTFTFDLSSITELTGSSLSQSADGFLISDAGTLKVMPYDQAGILVVSQSTAQTLAITDANTVQILSGTTNRIWTIPPNSSVAFEIGSVIICQNTGTGDLTITAGTGVIIDSIFHAAAATAQSDRVRDGGTAVLIKTATDTWALSGDIADS